MWQVHLSVYIYTYLSICLSVHLDAIAFYPDNSTSFFPQSDSIEGLIIIMHAF